jgi:hypothetical protein
VIDVDQQGVALVHNRQRSTQRFASCRHDSELESRKAKQGGAATVIVSNAPSGAVQAAVETIVANKS